VDHSVFYKNTSSGCVVPAVYVDDISLTDSDRQGIQRTKKHLMKNFFTRDTGRPRHFLDIEFTYAKGKMMLSQRKYVLDLLEDWFIRL